MIIDIQFYSKETTLIYLISIENNNKNMIHIDLQKLAVNFGRYWFYHTWTHPHLFDISTIVVLTIVKQACSKYFIGKTHNLSTWYIQFRQISHYFRPKISSSREMAHKARKIYRPFFSAIFIPGLLFSTWPPFSTIFYLVTSSTMAHKARKIYRPFFCHFFPDLLFSTWPPFFQPGNLDGHGA